MTLIDAEIFKENMDFICDAGGCLEPVTKAVREFVKYHIDGQTVVDAIPIEWIMEWATRYPELVSETTFVWMLEDWRKEQEKQNEAD